MAVNHNAQRWDFKRGAKQVLFKANFAGVWTPKRVVEPTLWQNPIGIDKMCLIVI